MCARFRGLRRRAATGLLCGLAMLAISPACSDTSSKGETVTTCTGSGGRSRGGAGGMVSGGNDVGGASGASGAGASAAAADTCGDGERFGAEECDDGNLENGDGCDADCHGEPREASCGDAEKTGDEACDDGNLLSGDGCSAECRIESCGNGALDAGEECDPPRARACSDRCKRVRESCGDGHVDAGEQCDDGNSRHGDGCDECVRECGDGKIDRAIGEECEPSLSIEGRCSPGCKLLPQCGDGQVQAGEECDPSNGLTCVGCRRVTPGNSGCGGVMGVGGEGGTCGAECVPEVDPGLVQNGGFDSDASGWFPRDPNLVTLSVVDDGSPAPKALKVSLAQTSLRVSSGAYQCLPVEAGTKYEFRAKYQIPGSAPSGVGASVTALLFQNTSCDGAFLSPPASGPEGRVRGAWTPYEFVLDTGVLSGPGRVLLRLSAVSPAGAEGSAVLWDSVSLDAPGSQHSDCGNCKLDPDEECDDGNRRAGDGCDSGCRRERCGDGRRSPSEECDDGNVKFGAADDACTPDCRLSNACDACAASSCGEELGGCLAIDGEADAGPAAGSPRSALCARLRACVQASACSTVPRTTAGVSGAFLENCYCGSSGDDCFSRRGAANGSCRAEIEAALETTSPASILSRFGGADAHYPLLAAVKSLSSCEARSCAADCVRESKCGDGKVQDRNFDFQFVIDREPVPCADALTHTGRGCSFEECDDGNLSPGDGCDEHCLVEACGNNLVQVGEACDDGNRTSGDGCSADCQAEFVCGNGQVEAPFEECDPSGGDHVCSAAEYEKSPMTCACDAACSRVVCGNGVVQRPLEQCDPPNGFSCGDDCKLLDTGTCEACINADPELASYNEQLCNTDASCVRVKQCILDSGCFTPTPASCYCGPNLGDCDLPDFVPSGPCADEIREGAGSDGPKNQDVLLRFFSLDYPMGIATAVLDAAKTSCQVECFP